MARVINGEISGRFRDKVFRRTEAFGVVVAEYNEGVYEKKVWTEAQWYARRKFKVLAGLSAGFRESSNLGFEFGKKVLSQPCFIRNNYNVLMDRDDGGFDVDYPSVCMSKGVLPQLEDLSGEVVGETLVLNWRYTARRYVNLGKERVRKSLRGDRNGGDRVVVVIHCPEYDDGARYKSKVFDGVALRESCGLRVDIPENFRGLRIYVYAFVIDDQKRSSDTQFIDIERMGKGEDDDFVSKEQRGVENEDIAVRRGFVMRFSVDEEEIEELLEESADDDSLTKEGINGVRMVSQLSDDVLRNRIIMIYFNSAFWNLSQGVDDDVGYMGCDELCGVRALQNPLYFFIPIKLISSFT